MTPNTAGILLGGVFAALIYGIAAVFMKSGLQAGIGAGPYLIISGLAAAVSGLVISFFLPDMNITVKGFTCTATFGVLWAVANFFIFIAIGKFKVPLGKLVPLYNMNTVIAVLLCLWIFSEYKQVQVIKLIIGTILVTIGGVLAALS